MIVTAIDAAERRITAAKGTWTNTLVAAPGQAMPSIGDCLVHKRINSSHGVLMYGAPEPTLNDDDVDGSAGHFIGHYICSEAEVIYGFKRYREIVLDTGGAASLRNITFWGDFTKIVDAIPLLAQIEAWGTVKHIRVGPGKRVMYAVPGQLRINGVEAREYVARFHMDGGRGGDSGRAPVTPASTGGPVLTPQRVTPSSSPADAPPSVGGPSSGECDRAELHGARIAEAAAAACARDLFPAKTIDAPRSAGAGAPTPEAGVDASCHTPRAGKRARKAAPKPAGKRRGMLARAPPASSASE